MKYAKQIRTSFMAILILTVPLFLLSPHISPAHATDPPAPQYTYKAISQTYLVGSSTGGSYLDTHYDDTAYHTSTGRMFRFWDPEYGRLIYFGLDVVYTFSVNSTGIPLPPNFMNITRVEVNGKAHTDESSSETVDLYILNCNTGGWHNIAEFQASTTDQSLNWTTTNNCNNYLAANGDMKLKWHFFAEDFNQLYLNYQCIKLNIAAHQFKWTFMVYLDSDWCFEIPGEINQPIYLRPPDPIIIPGEQFGYQEMSEMETVGSTNDVAIIVQIDRYYGGADRYLITHDTNTTTINSPILQTLGEVNMANPATLTDFINWTNTWYPADRLILVPHDHGQGFLGTLKDDYSEDDMSMPELKTALNNAKTAIGNKKIDIIGFIACLMQMTEVAYQIRDYGKVLVASEEVMYAAMGPNAEINVGWPFDTILANLTTTPSMNETTLAKVIIDRLKDLFYQHSDYIDVPPTLSAVNLDQVGTLAQQLDTLSGVLISKLNETLKTFIQDCRTHAQQFFFTPYIDLYNFTKALHAYPDPEIQQATYNVMTQINNTVIYEWHWPYGSSINPGFWKPKDAHGISIYFPTYSITYTEYRTAYEELDVSTTYRWDNFLRAYHEIT